MRMSKHNPFSSLFWCKFINSFRNCKGFFKIYFLKIVNFSFLRDFCDGLALFRRFMLFLYYRSSLTQEIEGFHDVGSRGGLVDTHVTDVAQQGEIDGVAHVFLVVVHQFK